MRIDKIIQEPKFWVLALFSCLYFLYLSVSLKVENISQVGISLLFGWAIALLLNQKKNQLVFKHKALPVLIGIILILGFLGLVLIHPQSPFLRVMPFTIGLGVSLIASGFSGLHQFFKELTILFFLGVPSVISHFLIDISPLTAKFASVFLLYIGFENHLEQVQIFLPTGSITVVYDCSGIDQMNYLLGLSVLCLILYPVSGLFNQLLVPFLALLLGFLANVVRVAMMAVFAASNLGAFHFWHTGEGSYVFAFVAVFVLGIIYKYLLHRDELKSTLRTNFHP